VPGAVRDCLIKEAFAGMINYRYLNRCHPILFAVLCACLLPLGCRHSPEQRYDLKGKVVSVDKGQRQVTIAHEKINGLMDAMTMPFSVKEDWALSVLAPGQTVEATLVIRGDRSWIEGLRIHQTKDSGNGAPLPSLPKIGSEVPDFRLLNQEGKPIHLHSYRGRPLLLTFIYTRCPLPDYCPRTSKNFSEIYQGLQSMPQPGRKPHLLTISFDADYDTPAVLRAYAGRYMHPAVFNQWEFATGSPDEIKEIAGYFGLSYWRESGQITHNLVTALIGPDGKLDHLYTGNEWTSQQILAELNDSM
jgi:protein SCO1